MQENEIARTSTGFLLLFGLAAAAVVPLSIALGSQAEQLDRESKVESKVGGKAWLLPAGACVLALLQLGLLVVYIQTGRAGKAVVLLAVLAGLAAVFAAEWLWMEREDNTQEQKTDWTFWTSLAAEAVAAAAALLALTVCSKRAAVLPDAGPEPCPSRYISQAHSLPPLPPRPQAGGGKTLKRSAETAGQGMVVTENQLKEGIANLNKVPGGLDVSKEIASTNGSGIATAVRAVLASKLYALAPDVKADTRKSLSLTENDRKIIFMEAEKPTQAKSSNNSSKIDLEGLGHRFMDVWLNNQGVLNFNGSGEAVVQLAESQGAHGLWRYDMSDVLQNLIPYPTNLSGVFKNGEEKNQFKSIADVAAVKAVFDSVKVEFCSQLCGRKNSSTPNCTNRCSLFDSGIDLDKMKEQLLARKTEMLKLANQT